VQDGWIVAWVDGRDGNGEVYAAKVDRSLRPVGRGQRITGAQGDASDVSLAVANDGVWVAWSDPRESPREGLGDIYATKLSKRDASRVADEVHVMATAAHSRSPQILALRDGAVVVWIEDSPGEIEGQGSVLSALLDGGGRVARTQRVPLAGDGKATAVAALLQASPESGELLALVTRALGGDVTLDASKVELAADGTSSSVPLLDLDAPSAFDVSLALEGKELYYTDIGRSPGSHRVRRATLTW
jgi:hypothetical protein